MTHPTTNQLIHFRTANGRVFCTNGRRGTSSPNWSKVTCLACRPKRPTHATKGDN